MSFSEKNWKKFWATRKNIIKNFAKKILILFPFGSLLAIQLSAGIGCLFGESKLCISLIQIIPKMTVGFYIFILFGTLVVFLQFVYFHWDKYLKEENTNTPNESES